MYDKRLKERSDEMKKAVMLMNEIGLSTLHYFTAYLYMEKKSENVDNGTIIGNQGTG